MKISSPLEAHLPRLKSLWKDAFGDTDAFLDMFERTAFSPDRARCAFENDQPVAVLYWFDCLYGGDKIAYLYAVTTDKNYRGRGICRTLIEDTHKHLKSLGYVGSILVPFGEDMFSFYEKLGYTTCCRVREFCCEASENSIDIKKIDEEEYATLRRKFIPKNGVLQENENITFLREQAEFYSGDGFLLAAREEKKMLLGVELLGDSTVAPNIVRTLGYKKGNFRVPGSDKPFAMYYPLVSKDVSFPSYFGLAFD